MYTARAQFRRVYEIVIKTPPKNFLTFQFTRYNLSIFTTTTMGSDRLKRLKALKERESYKPKDEEDEEYKIYDELSNEEFRKVTRDRLMEDDFVVDDGGEGYMETGGYEWEENHNYYSEDEENQEVEKPNKKKQKTTKELKATKNDGNIQKLFRSAPAKPKSKPVSILYSTIMKKKKRTKKN